MDFTLRASSIDYKNSSRRYLPKSLEESRMRGLEKEMGFSVSDISAINLHTCPCGRLRNVAV